MPGRNVSVDKERPSSSDLSMSVHHATYSTVHVIDEAGNLH